MSIKDSGLAELNIGIKMNGISTSFSVEIYPEISRLSPEYYSDQSSADNILHDHLQAEILPILKAATPRLVELNQIISGNLLKACCRSCKDL